jgi:hypothetical protein
VSDIGQSTLLRLNTQLEVIPLLLTGAAPEAIAWRPSSGKWSAHENLAHLARHHAVFLERVGRILSEDSPELGRYSAETDAEWPAWSTLTTTEVLARMTTLRSEIKDLIKNLTDGQSNRIGVHPLFGAMTVRLWIEFFLVHEAHHLYVMMIRLGEAKRSMAG